MENVYLQKFQKQAQTRRDSYYDPDEYRKRDGWTKQYAWAVPSKEALDIIAKYAPIVEMGAGTGYWAALLQARDVNVTAMDIAPPGGSQENDYKHSVTYTHVHKGEPADLARFKKHALFLCWPPYATPMAYECLMAFKGDTVIYVGEGFGGCTGDDPFHDLLNEDWEEVEHCDIPQYCGIRDSLTVYRRKNAKLVARVGLA